MNLKAWIAPKWVSLRIMLTVPGSYAAWRDGCHVAPFAFVKKLESYGIWPSTVLDIGANKGMFTRCTHRVFPQADIFAFEPLRDCFCELRSLQSSIPRLSCYPFALGDKNELATLYHSSYDYSSSMLRMADLHKKIFPKSAGTIEETVEVRTLDSVLDGVSLRPPVLMKIDVQGFELAVLRGAKHTLESVDFAVCEVSLKPLYEGQPRADELHSTFETSGLTFRAYVDELRAPVSREVLQMDALFVRKSTQ